MQRYFCLVLFVYSFLFAQEANHIILTQITTEPTDAEVIVIYNPTNDPIDLSDYYLSDVTSYYQLPTGSGYFPSNENDFIVRFPDISINSGDSLTISIKDATTFNDYYSYDSDLSLVDDMINIGNDGQAENYNIEDANLSDNYEFLMLFYWDGSSSIVQDVDYFVWGFGQAGIDKTGVGDYYPDTDVNTQNIYVLGSHDYDYSYVRKSSTENGEEGPPDITGNGITGHNETSEMFNQSWEIILNPLRPAGCTDNTACNFDSVAAYNDGTCLYAEEYYDCDGECLLDDDQDGICNVFEIFGCMDPDAVNYVEEAEFDNGACNISGNSIEEIIFENSGQECNDNLDSQYSIIGLVVGYDDKTSSGGPQIIVLQDDSGYQIDAVVWDWDVLDSNKDFMFDPYDPSEYVIYVSGTLGTYNCSWQFEIASENDILLYDVYHPQGNYNEDNTIIKAEIIPEPYVVIPSIGERLDFEYSFPSNSRVTIRIFDLDGRFITSIVDRFYGDGGIVTRTVDGADWDGKDHLSQIVDPGTYLIHIEATNYLTGESSSDIAPIVVGVNY